MTPQELQTVLEATLEAQTQTNSLLDWAPLLLSIVAIVIAFIQLQRVVERLKQTAEIAKADHERSRRVATADLLKYYQSGTKTEHNKIVQLLDRLPADQLLNLRDARPISLTGDLKEIACAILNDKFPDAYQRHGCDNESKEQPATLSHAEIMHIRFMMIDILNHYETCLLPWKLGIVDQAEIEIQFKTLVDLRDGKYKLAAARETFGENKFPATVAFKNKVCGAPTSPKASQPISPTS